MFTITNCHSVIICHFFTAVCLHYTWPAERYGSGVANMWSARYLESTENCESFVDATPTESQQIRPMLVFSITYYYLVPYRLSTDSITRDLEWPFCVKFSFAPVCLELELEPGIRSLAILFTTFVVNVVGELWTEKNTCGIAQFPCDSTAFLLSVLLL